MFTRKGLWEMRHALLHNTAKPSQNFGSCRLILWQQSRTGARVLVGLLMVQMHNALSKKIVLAFGLDCQSPACAWLGLASLCCENKCSSFLTKIRRKTVLVFVFVLLTVYLHNLKITRYVVRVLNRPFLPSFL